VIERLTYRYLINDSKRSQSSLQRLFKHYLNHPPKFQIKRRAKAHLIIDGTYWNNDTCLILYYDNDIKYTQLYRITKSETYREIKEDLENLRNLGIGIESITCDGNKAILKAVRKVYPEIILQRCTVHVHRMTHIWLRIKPIHYASKDLKKLINLLPKVETYNDKLQFTRIFLQWYEANKAFVNEKTINQKTQRWWYKHRNLRRASVMILKALPDLFHYIDNPKVPKSTNALESFFGHLKDTLSIHRGLSYKNRKAFITWYLHFKNQSR